LGESPVVAAVGNRKPAGPWPKADALPDFLRRHPFVSQQVLESVFGERGLRIFMSQCQMSIRRVNLPGLGSCFAEEREPGATLIGNRRREIARRFAAQVFGAASLSGGISPGIEADLGFPWNRGRSALWWRVWVDLGGCAPEALRFIAEPPGRCGSGVRDLILTTDPQRLELLAPQIEGRWGGKQPIHLISLESLSHRTVAPRASNEGAAWIPPDEDQIQALICARQRGSHHRSRLAKAIHHLSGDDWSLLAMVGDHPLFTPIELSSVGSGNSRALVADLGRLAGLERLGLIESARDLGPSALIEGRKLLTWRGLGLLAGHWGSSSELMRRFHPWPQVQDQSGRVVYSTGWLRTQDEHQRLVRQFGLALVDGARRVSNSRGGVKVALETTIAARISYRLHNTDAAKSVSWVAPDARACVRFWRVERGDGRRSNARNLERFTLWVEVDRGTIPVNRLGDRMDRYVSALNAMRARNPALIWVIDGSPYREKQILDLMKARDIDGWTVLLERLILPKEDRWWLLHPYFSISRESRVGLPHEAIGGMSPWRPVWHSCADARLRPLLGLEPWRA
jgi:hypothetical protein